MKIFFARIYFGIYNIVRNLCFGTQDPYVYYSVEQPDGVVYKTMIERNKELGILDAASNLGVKYTKISKKEYNK